MRKKLKALIYEKYGTQESFCKHVNEEVKFPLHYSKLSRFIGEYVIMTEEEKKVIARELGVKESKRAMDDLFKGEKEEEKHE
jgi:RNA polymerase subunit RPABC4/transcription elongation factor Spt4